MQFIHLVEGAYPKQSCTYLIDFFETNISIAQQGWAGNKKLNNLEIPLELDFKNPNSNIFGLENTLENILFQYKQKFPLVDTNIGKWHVSPTCQLSRFEPNNFYNFIHCDVGKTCRNRIFAWMIYLNDIKTGGGTHFIHQNFTTKPISGDLYIWPAGWTHMHVGVNAPHETKYILTGWVEYV